MPASFSESIEEFEDENGARFVVFKIQRKKNLVKSMMIAAMEIVSEAALVAFTLKSSFHPAWPIIVSAMGVVSVTDLFRNARKYIRKLSRLKRDRLRISCFLAIGAIAYFAAVHGFSVALKCNNQVWIFPCLGVAATCYNLAIKAMTRLGRTVLNRSPFMKCCQLLFGPALIGSAAFYLLIFRQHEEEWVLCLPMVASATVGNDITSVGYGRVESNNEPRWLLFKGLELLVGGCLLLANGSVLLFYGASNQFHPVFVALFAGMIFTGIAGITNSLESFQGCSEMEAPVFYSICGMIVGPIFFLSACISIRCIGHPNMMPLSVVMAIAGHGLLLKAVTNLHGLVPQPVFNRYCQRVLGPMVTVYTSLAAAFASYSMGWRFSLAIMPFIPVGIYATYTGFRRRNQPQ